MYCTRCKCKLNHLGSCSRSLHYLAMLTPCHRASQLVTEGISAAARAVGWTAVLLAPCLLQGSFRASGNIRGIRKLLNLILKVLKNLVVQKRSRESFMVRRRPMVAQQCFVSFFHVCLLGEVRGLFKSRSSSASRGPFSSRTNTTKAATFLQVWFGAVSHRQSLQGMCRSGFTSGHPAYDRGFHTIYDSFMRGHITDEEMKDWPDEDPRKAGLLVRFFHRVWSVSCRCGWIVCPCMPMSYSDTRVLWWDGQVDAHAAHYGDHPG